MSRSTSPTLPVYNTDVDKMQIPLETRSSGQSSSITSTYSFLSPEETATRTQSSLSSGLSTSESRNRLSRDGPNELPNEEEEPLWLRFVKQFKETLILLLLCSAAISLFIGNRDDAISITLAVTIVVTVGFVQEYRSEKSLEALNKLVPHSAHVRRAGEHRPKGDMSDAMSLTNGVAEVKVQQGSSSVLASQLVVGDLVLFATGDRIPADIRITKAADLTIDESNLTGENEPVEKDTPVLQPEIKAETRPSSPMFASDAAGTVGADVRLNQQHNIAFMGTLVRSGYGEGIVIATGGKTEFGAISLSLQEIEAPRTPLQQSMDRLGKQLSYISFGIIGVIMLIGLLQGKRLLDLFTIGVSLAVAAIPEGLPIIVTVTLALGVLRMAKRGAIVRKLPSVETLGSVNVVCSDKTGTLTMNHMTVTKMWHFDAGQPFAVETTGNPSAAIKTLLRIGNIANNAKMCTTSSDTPAVASAAAVLSSTRDPNATSTKSRWIGQPTDVAVLDLLDTFGEDDVRLQLAPRSIETPFSSERKWMGVVIPASMGEVPMSYGASETAYIKGALERVLDRCDTYLTKEGREVILDEARRQEATVAARAMAEEGLRVIGFASGSVKKQPSRSSTPGAGGRSASRPTRFGLDGDLFQGLCFAGIVGMSDPPRKDVHRSIRRLMMGGVKVIMITGDAETTAVAIARKLGMGIQSSGSEARSVLRGDELDKMSEDDLREAISTTTIFARTSPDHKMKIVRALQARGDVVAMTGDGVNDAPALKKADIGVAMGLLGTDVAKEAADMILTDDDFSTILRAIEQGKGIFYNIQNFITFQLSTSVAALSLVLLSSLFGFRNPLNAMQILWINILMDGPPAQSLGVEPVDPRVMTQPPRPRNANVLTQRLVRRVVTQAAVIMLGTFFMYIHEMGEGDPSTASESGLAASNTHLVVTRRDTTMTFTTFVLFDMFNALTCRSESKSVLLGELKLFGNNMFNYAVAGSLVGQLCVIYLPFLQRVFQTEAVGFWDLVHLIAMTSSVFWVDEVRKIWVKKGPRLGGRWRGTRINGYSVNV